MTSEDLLNRLKNDGRVKYLIDEFIRSIGQDLTKYKKPINGTIWRGNEAIKARLERKLKKLQLSLQEVMSTMCRQAWELAEQENDAFVLDYLKKVGITAIGADLLLKYFNRVALDEEIKKNLTVNNIQTLPRNVESLKSFLKNDLKLSRRVWKVTSSTKKAIQHYLTEGLAEGKSAAKISQDIRKFLINPDTRFRRLRDPETGKLIYSQPMKDFHPGRGVYRSAYKNAWRLARSEVSRSYQLADNTRWKRLDFVTGFEVKLSNNHPKSDQCDDLQGKYPKSFIFSLWHANCICYAVPLTLSKNDFARHLKGEKIGRSKYMTRIPGSAHKWVRDNQSKILAAPGRPYWIDDNFRVKASELKLNI